MSLTTKQKWWLGSGITAASLALIYVVTQVKKTYNSIYTVVGIIVKNISFTDINFTLLFKIENKGGIGIDITKQSYDIYVNKMFVSHVDYPSKEQLNACSALPTSAAQSICKNQYITRIAHDSNSTMPLNVQFNPSDLLKAGMQNISAILSNQQNVVINIKGNLTFNAGPIKMTDFPFEETMTLADIIKNSAQVKS